MISKPDGAPVRTKKCVGQFLTREIERPVVLPVFGKAHKFEKLERTSKKLDQ